MLIVQIVLNKRFLVDKKLQKDGVWRQNSGGLEK